MTAARGLIGLGLIAATMFAAGCRTPSRTPPLPPPTPPPSPPTLTAVTPQSLEPALSSLPLVDAGRARADEVAPPPTEYLGLTEEVCQREAAARAGIPGLFSRENRIPPRRAERGFSAAADNLSREVRVHLAREGRNRAAAEALEEFFQLADAQGRGEILRATLPVLDQLRATVRQARAEGVRVPVDPDELDRQRATLLGLITQADLGAESLDIDLKRRIGYPNRPGQRLRPVADFAVSAEAVDLDRAIRTALEQRPDLTALREAYLRLSRDSLPAVREMLRGAVGQGGSAVGVNATVAGAAIRPAAAILLARIRSRQLDQQLLAELAIRRQQLADLILERERQAADEVRAAVANLNAQSVQVGLARWRVEQLHRRVQDARAQGSLAEQSAQLEALRGRADVVAAVMNWHRARVRLSAAQGLLAGEDPPSSNGPICVPPPR